MAKQLRTRVEGPNGKVHWIGLSKPTRCGLAKSSEDLTSTRKSVSCGRCLILGPATDTVTSMDHPKKTGKTRKVASPNQGEVDFGIKRDQIYDMLYSVSTILGHITQLVEENPMVGDDTMVKVEEALRQINKAAFDLKS